MEDDDFVEKSSQGSASHSKGVSRDDGKFVRALPVTTKAQEKLSGCKRVSGTDDSTAVAGKLIKTDDSQQPSQDVSITEDQKGSQLECAKREDSLFGSPGSKLQKKLAKNGTLSIFCIRVRALPLPTPAP